MTAATSQPREVGENCIRVFERLGAELVKIVYTENREDVEHQTSFDIIKEAIGIFLQEEINPVLSIL